MLEIVSQAIEAGRVDLYLQPVVTLPGRRASYFEALTRIRTKCRRVDPARFLSPGGRDLRHDAADRQCAVGEERADLAPARVRLPRQGRVLQHLNQDPARSRVLSPSLVEFMEENSGLSESLIFEVGQPGIFALSADEMGASIRWAHSATASRSIRSPIRRWIRRAATTLVRYVRIMPDPSARLAAGVDFTAQNNPPAISLKCRKCTQARAVS